jgi:hypothetical protein
MDHVAGPLQILLGEKEGKIWFNIICLKLSQFERITWWCSSISESTLQFVMLEIKKKKKKLNGLPDFASSLPLDENSRRP